jgi:hypothetical protein
MHDRLERRALDQLFRLGYGSGRNLYPRNPRLEFDQANGFA